jgi:hypothetical protein
MGLMVALALFAFVGLSVAVAANCASGKQDPYLPVTLCTNATSYTNGQTAVANGFVTNHTGKAQSVTVTLSIAGPLSTSTTTTISVNAGSTYHSSSSIPITAIIPRGVYTVSGTATLTNGKSSSASVMVTIH